MQQFGMEELIGYLTSPQGLPVINGLACAVFAVCFLVSLQTRKIYLGYMVPIIRKSEKPQAYWSVLILYGVAAAWTGALAAFQVLTRATH